MKFTVEWLKAALIRMIRTAAQVALGMLTIGATVSEIDWRNLISVSLVAAVYSLLTSVITDLPEIGNDGTIHVDGTGSISAIDMDLDAAELAKKNLIKFKIEDAAANDK